MRRNLSRCCRTGTQENEGKIWNIGLVSLRSLYWFGLNEEIVSLRNAECVIHGPGWGGSPAKHTQFCIFCHCQVSVEFLKPVSPTKRCFQCQEVTVEWRASHGDSEGRRTSHDPCVFPSQGSSVLHFRNLRVQKWSCAALLPTTLKTDL